MKPFSVKEIIETPIGQAICMTWRFEPGAYGVVELKRSEEIGALPGPKTKGGKRRAWPAGQGLEVHQITPERRQTTILPAHARARETGLGSTAMKPSVFRELFLSILTAGDLLFLCSDLRAAPRLDDKLVAQAPTLPSLTSGRQYLGRELEPFVG